MTKPLPSNHSSNLVPFNADATLSSIEVKTQVDEKIWAWEFKLNGDLSKIILPTFTHQSKRQDELWKSTCFEAFVAISQNNYIEFNFSPTGNWNCYRFSGYRENMRQFSEIELLDFTILSNNSENQGNYHCRMSVKLANPLPISKMGMTAVIQTTNGNINYWALKHGGEKADFHREQDWLFSFDATSDSL